MFCPNCGRKVPDSAKFCTYCGENMSGCNQPTNQQKSKKIPMVFISILILLILLGGGIGGFLYLRGNRNSSSNKITSKEQLQKAIKNLNSKDSSDTHIDFKKKEYKVGKESDDLKWDSSLFYRLEDTGESKSKGELANYLVEKKRLIDKDTGNQIDYEIYRNPDNEKVNRISAVESVGEILNITDYYFEDNGKINFIFKRTDSVYTPTYAKPGLDGQRFYFCKDKLVQWRRVSNGEGKDICLNQTVLEHSSRVNKTLYANASSSDRKKYDSLEAQMLNEAYNIYHQVLKAVSVGKVYGYIVDGNGKALSNISVSVYCSGFDGVLYKSMTDHNGRYEIFVPDVGKAYKICASGSGYRNVNVYNISITNQMVSAYQETIYMIKEEKTTYPVTFTVLDASNYISENSKKLKKVSSATIKIRKGFYNKTGSVIKTIECGNDGVATTKLEMGCYTAEVSQDGYITGYYNVVCNEDNNQEQIDLSTTLEDEEMRVVLSWNDEPKDLDSHLFTPKSSSEDEIKDCHIWFGRQEDSAGNSLDVDDTDGYGPETITIKNAASGDYKYYVADYTNCSQENFSSKAMSLSGATVSVYTKNGLIAKYAVPEDVEGVIWELFEIRNGELTPCQRYYSNVEDKPWWQTDDKEELETIEVEEEEPETTNVDIEAVSEIKSDLVELRGYLSEKTDPIREKYGEPDKTDDIVTSEYQNVPLFGYTGTLSVDCFEARVAKIEFYDHDSNITGNEEAYTNNFIQAIDEVMGTTSTVTRDEGTYDYSRKWNENEFGDSIEMKMSQSNGETFIFIRLSTSNLG